MQYFHNLLIVHMAYCVKMFGIGQKNNSLNENLQISWNDHPIGIISVVRNHDNLF
jgi:hypothetical protein